MTFAQIYTRKVAAGEIAADPAQERLLPQFDRLARDLSQAPERRGWFSRRAPAAPKGLYIWGGVGRGKSMLMDLFVAEAGVARTRRIHFHAFMQEVHRGIAAARRAGAEDAVAPVAAGIATDLRLLCLDEMQIGDITDAMIVGRLFEALIAGGVAVVTTSNRHPDDLYRDGLNRALFLPFIGLIKEQLEVMELASPRDWRQTRIAGSGRYFVPADAAARAAIDAIWYRLSGGGVDELRLKVGGREVVVPQFSGGVARASFADLCGRPLGAADYLALAERVRVLILEDVPRLSRDNHDRARRFVTLVDALYEARVRTVISAADAPDALYTEGEGAFEFRRTASRLHEMTSEDWGRAA